MRRKDKEITNIDEILKIIDSCKICRIAFSDNDQPYVIPMNYGYSYENGVLTFYFHSASEGRKIEIIKKNDKTCFEIDCDLGIVEADIPCKYSQLFKCVIGFGKIFILNSDEEKTAGLNLIMKQITGNYVNYSYTESELKKVFVIKMVVNEFSGKQKLAATPRAE